MFSLTWCGQTSAKKVTLSKFEEYNSGEATADYLLMIITGKLSVLMVMMMMMVKAVVVVVGIVMVQLLLIIMRMAMENLHCR